MAAFERTAYPRFKRHPTAGELTTFYTPTPEEFAWAIGVVRTEGLRLALLAALKAFQRAVQPFDAAPATWRRLRSSPPRRPSTARQTSSTWPSRR